MKHFKYTKGQDCIKKFLHKYVQENNEQMFELNFFTEKHTEDQGHVLIDVTLKDQLTKVEGTLFFRKEEIKELIKILRKHSK